MNDWIYLYGVGRSGLRAADDRRVVGPGSGAIGVVLHGDLGALVGTVTERDVPLTPANLAAHQHVIEAVAERDVVLPARFGTVVENEELLIEQFLAPRCRALRRALDRVDGQVEVRVTVRHDGDQVIEEATRRNVRALQLARRVQNRPQAATYYDRIRLGELIMAEVGAIQERDLAELQRQMAPIATESKRLGSPNSDRACIAYLVERGRLDRFDEQIERFGARSGRPMSFEVVGPLAPWDFAELDVDPTADGEGTNRRRRGQWHKSGERAGGEGSANARQKWAS